MYRAIAFYVQPFVMSALMERLQNALKSAIYFYRFPSARRRLITQEYIWITESLGRRTAGINVTGSFQRAKMIVQIVTS